MREDVLRWILNQVRDPLVALDVKGRSRRSIAAASACSSCSSVGASIRSKRRWSKAFRVHAKSWRYVWRNCRTAQWREVQYIDHDGHNPEIYKIICTMTKKGRRLDFDFTGTSPNARGLINSTYAGLQAAV